MCNDCSTHRLEPPITLEHIRDTADTLSPLTVDTEAQVERAAAVRSRQLCTAREPAHSALSILRPSIHVRPLRRLHNDAPTRCYTPIIIR